MKQIIEWASDGGSRVRKLGRVEMAAVPELEPVEVVRSHLDIIIHSAMLEEKLLVAPEG